MLPYILIIIAATLAAAGIVVSAPNNNQTGSNASTQSNSSSQGNTSTELVEKEGTCQDFNTLLKTAGVEHNEGDQTISDPGLHGTTLVTYEDIANTSSKVERPFKGAGKHYKCHCSGTVYDNQSKCVSECKVSLGCFSGVCKEIGEAKECVDVTYTLPPDILSMKIYAAQWKPPASASPACKEMAAKWNKKVTDHENEHAKLTDDIVNKFKDKAKGGLKYTACADTLQEARDKAQKDFEKDIQQFQEEIDSKDHIDEYDKAESLDCSKCP